MGYRQESAVVRAAAGLSVIAILLVYQTTTFWQNGQVVLSTLTGMLAGVLILVNLACIDILRLSPADSHTFRSLLEQYLFLFNLRLASAKTLRCFYQDICDCKKAQEDILMEIIRKNEGTAYGHDHSFSAIRSCEDFMRFHPLTTYCHYEDYIGRVERGEQKVLTSDEVRFLVCSSATTGKTKRYPYTAEYSAKCAHTVFSLYYASILHMLNLKRLHFFHLYAPVDFTDGGNIPYGFLKNCFGGPSGYDIIPHHYNQIFREDVSYYVQALFALAERELHHIRGFSSNLMYSFFKFIEDHQEELCRTIANGTIDKTVSLDADVRVQLQARLRADRYRAQKLRREFAKGPVGFAKRIWPDLAFVGMAKSASFGLCAKLLESSYLQGVKILSIGHRATEGLLGLVLENEPWVAEVMTMLPRSGFWEFIPLEQVDSEKPQTLLMHQLEEGEFYEIVSTNENGLYRCRVGDVIKVVGFARTTPKYEILYRLGQRLNIDDERTPESTLYEALEIGSENWPPDVTLIDYTTTESGIMKQLTGERSVAYYVFFIEISGEYADRRIFTTTHEMQIDSALCALRKVYRVHRNKGSIRPPRIIQVRSGTFDELKRHLWGKRVNAQFKMPRVLRKVDEIEFLLQQEIKPKNFHTSDVKA